MTCEHPSCTRSPAPGCCLCRRHSGLLALPAARWPAPTPQPALADEIARLAAQRDRVQRWLEESMAHGPADPAEARRTLAALSQAGRTLAAMLEKHSSSGADERQRLLAEAGRRVLERAAQEEGS